MLQSATTSVPQLMLVDEHLTPRRIRHVTGIQIRNLTPFPIRDAFTLALNQPVELSNLDAGITDDIGATLNNVRSRRISTSSNATRRSQKREDNVVEQDIILPTEGRGGGKSSISLIISNPSPNNTSQRFSPSKSIQSLRSNRARTSSMTSSSSIQRLGNSSFVASSSHSLLFSNSQASLERVIASRLVETFIVITIPPTTQWTRGRSEEHLNHAKSSCSAPSKSTFTPTSPSRNAARSPIHLRGAPGSSKKSNGRVPSGSSLPKKAAYKVQSLKTEDRVARVSANRQTAPVAPVRSSSLKKKGKAAATTPSEEVANPVFPVYFSPIHRPSTNPYFPVDPRPGQDFPVYCDVGGQVLTVEIWGRMAMSHRREGTVHEDPSQAEVNRNNEWRLLDDWDVDLLQLIPLPHDLDANSTQLPSNTLVVNLQPPGQSFYLPSSVKPIARSESPSLGYSSDPESEIRKAKQVTEQQVSCSAISFNSTEGAPQTRKRRQRGLLNGLDDEEQPKTVTWQELFNFISLQSSIADTRVSLQEIVKNLDELLENDETFSLQREISERESRIRELKANHCAVLDRVAQRRQELADRSQRLRQRAEFLSSAADAIRFDSAAKIETENQWSQLAQLRQQTSYMQTSLVSTLSTIFPIELYSSPDLLFTILDIPLAIPVTSNDPAPPLTLPAHKDVTEETVATALGYVAQVVHLLAAYTGKNLIYPVTCIGSRSLIKDGISAMVGPRMFPLFSKSVDTYRFEYGVYLLNKNIELLMADRDLRALDMRHTLPNLKNLLLTLSHSAIANPTPPLCVPSPQPSTNRLETPPLEPSSSSEDVKTPKALHVTPSTAVSEGDCTPPQSGMNTPTASTDEPRKGKSSFLGFVPFTDFLRVRYPSQGNSSEKTIRNNSSGETSDAEAGENEDQRTIHTISPDHCKESVVTQPAISSEEVIEA